MKSRRNILAVIASTAFLALALAFTPAVFVNAQTATTSTSTDNGIFNIFGDANSTTTGTTTGTSTGTTTPGLPETGAGGDAAMNIAILGIGALIAAGSAYALISKRNS